MSVERNEEICRLYVSGLTIYDLSPQFNLSHERIRQILRKSGVFKTHRQKISPDRFAFLGVNLTDDDKEALREEAGKAGLSMSELTSDWIKEKLEELKSLTEKEA